MVGTGWRRHNLRRVASVDLATAGDGGPLVVKGAVHIFMLLRFGF
jgi:hypothetical protein